MILVLVGVDVVAGDDGVAVVRVPHELVTQH